MEEVSGRDAYERLQKLLIDKKDKLRVMERQIDIEIQMAYFKKSTETKKDLPSLDVMLSSADNLFDENTDIETKRKLLNQLASFEEVKCFRILEKYMKTPDKELKNWSYLAYQESLMTMESSLSEEDTIYISSGLGGKGNKLRYFVVLLSDSPDVPISEKHQHLILKEIVYQFEKSNAEFEEHSFNNTYFMFSCLIPIDISIADLFEDFINNVNEFEPILSDNFLITNVRRMSVEEINEFIEKKIDLTNED